MVAERYARKPPVLEGDINFIELHYPELAFIRVKEDDPREPGYPCLATSSGIGDIYFCPTVEEDYRSLRIHSRVIVCNKFEFDGIEEELCSAPCLVPAGGRYHPPELFEVRPREEGGVCARIELTPVEGVFTEYGAEAISQFIAIRDFLTGDLDFEKTVGENVLAAFAENLTRFAEKHKICEKDEERAEKFLRDVEELVFAALGRRTLEKILPEELFEKDLPLFSCEYLSKHLFVMHPDASRGTATTSYPFPHLFTFVTWKDEYESREFAERYFKQYESYTRVIKEFPRLSPRSLQLLLKEIAAEESSSAPVDMADELLDFGQEIFETILYQVKDELRDMDCWELWSVIGFDEQLCFDIDRYNELIEKMSEHEPIPGMEEEREKKMAEYEAKLHELYGKLSDYSRDYAAHVAESRYEELWSRTVEELDAIVSDQDEPEENRNLARKIIEFLGKLCFASREDYYHYCLEAAVESSAGE